MACTQKCDQGRLCTCGDITPTISKLIEFDIWAFKVVTWGKAKPRETASAAAWRGTLRGDLLPKFFRPIIDFIFGLFGEKDHCRKAYEWQRMIYPD